MDFHGAASVGSSPPFYSHAQLNNNNNYNANMFSNSSMASSNSISPPLIRNHSNGVGSPCSSQNTSPSPSRPLSPMAMSPPRNNNIQMSSSLPISIALGSMLMSTPMTTPVSFGHQHTDNQHHHQSIFIMPQQQQPQQQTSLLMPPPMMGGGAFMGPPMSGCNAKGSRTSQMAPPSIASSLSSSQQQQLQYQQQQRHSRQVVRRSVRLEESDGLTVSQKCRDERKSATLSRQASKRDMAIFEARRKSDRVEYNTINEGDLKKSLDENNKKRLEAIKEVMTSETTYNNYLNTIVDVYLVPLRKDYTSPEEVKFIVSIFSNIEQIREVSKSILCLFQSRLNNNITNDTIVSDLFLQILPSLNIYKEYYVNWYRSLHNLDQWLGKCKKLKKFIDDRSMTTLDLKSLMIMPCQRIPRYTLLIDAVLRYTNPLHTDFLNLQNALAQMKKMTESINERVRDSEKTQLVTNIRMRFDESIGFLDEMHRRLIKESPEFQLLPCKNISQINDHYVGGSGNGDDDDTDEEDYSTSASTTPKKKRVKLIPTACHLYLFNDLFVIGVRNVSSSNSLASASNKYSAVLKSSLATTVFRDYPTLPLKFSVHHSSGTYFFNAPSKEAKEQFVRECHTATDTLIKEDAEQLERRKRIRFEGNDEAGWTVFDPDELPNKFNLAQRATEELNQIQTQIFTPKKRKSVLGKMRERTRSLLTPSKSSNIKRSSSFVLNSLMDDADTVGTITSQ
ncbi:hypothetical protein SAMD00019534_124680 [Acytostelium subglobosum LB1]|uniref:hypothetical protein n=1 Tax=Acytostelium subglobosum LB1 TaxID=1410327 RepID=UPI000644EC3E|nr:hypothetical protein SAMD00019534_124680 [Acytostelium subglobosum LB1]GAM29292.1 hypothetical protein SAMD00019534_124680 [Acytostelium subglobosum LB1]|eukprot:XP_012747790.1 hypothetical protein SAMD00019534_124680 [Acytostelium subglobosum LB1]